MNNNFLKNVTTDKAMYAPNEEVTLTVSLEDKVDVNSLNFEVKVFHLENQIGQSIQKTVNLENGKEQQVSFPLSLPADDFRGYLVEVAILDQDGNQLESKTVGVDVSSTWVKFPRYGYVWDFTENVDTKRRIEKLKDYHINALQYYDWKYRHHKPIADNLEVWDDWSGRPIYGDSIRGYIKNAKSKNMVNMAYNMVYAATSGYEDDGVKQEWALYFTEDNPRGEGHFKFKMSDSTPTGVTHLFFFNMRNKEWQNYIFNASNKIFEAFDFDGWHGDTVGDWGEMQTADGEKLYVTDTYTEFLNAAKQAIGDKYLAFNPVGAQGIENVNKSDVDVLYAEIWPWDHDSEGEQYNSYYALKKEVEQSRKESGGKSLVVPAYMSYDYGEKNPGSDFNTSAVILTAATVYAAGGARMELGDDGKMLSNEYFPAQNLNMTEELTTRIKNLYDFIVAYENLLRDGQEEVDNTIVFPEYEMSYVGEPNKIWAYAKKDEQHEIVQIINLLGVTSNDWRANEGHKEKPTIIENFEMKYYYTDEIESIYVASPDVNNGKTKQLSFTLGNDEKGNYATCMIPTLEYWDMLYMTTRKK